MKNGLCVDDKGNKRWFKNDNLHRKDGPAIEWTDGYKEWWIEGKRNRTDGPAIECANGTKAWYIEGNLHRIDGPAIEDAYVYKAWWIEGLEYTERDYWKKLFELGYIDETEMMINLI